MRDMAALDTNVLVRFLVQDDAAQLAATKKLFRRCVDADESLFVPVTVTLELESVLRSALGFDKTTVMLGTTISNQAKPLWASTS